MQTDQKIEKSLLLQKLKFLDNEMKMKMTEKNRSNEPRTKELQDEVEDDKMLEGASQEEASMIEEKHVS